MKFRVSRTSLHNDEQPCEEARKELFVVVDERTVDDPSKVFPNSGVNWWYGYGENHRVENGHIKRDFPGKDWLIDISSFEKLEKFIDKHGEVVISKTTNCSPSGLRIEIYDDYRE